MSTEVSTKLKVGDIVKLHNGTETFRVRTIHKNGDVTCWGGSTNPNAYRSFRSFRPGVLRLESRKQVIKTWQ